MKWQKDREETEVAEAVVLIETQGDVAKVDPGTAKAVVGVLEQVEKNRKET